MNNFSTFLEMPKASEITESERSQIFRLRRIYPTWTLAKIAEAVNRDRSTVEKVLRCSENHKKTKRSGRPKVITPREDREIVKFAKKDRLRMVKIANELDLQCTPMTVYSRLVSDPTTRFDINPSQC